jgi:O-antigen/teichoic acid export membrane protein
LVVSVVALGTILFNCNYINGNILLLFKKTKTIALIYGVSALINIVLNIILVPLIGILGAATATLITFAIHLSMGSVVGFKKLPFDIDLKFIMKSVISSCVMSLMLVVLSPVGVINILISIGIAAIIYFGVMILLRGFTKEEYVFLM